MSRREFIDLSRLGWIVHGSIKILYYNLLLLKFDLIWKKSMFFYLKLMRIFNTFLLPRNTPLIGTSSFHRNRRNVPDRQLRGQVVADHDSLKKNFKNNLFSKTVVFTPAPFLLRGSLTVFVKRAKHNVNVLFFFFVPTSRKDYVIIICHIDLNWFF